MPNCDDINIQNSQPRNGRKLPEAWRRILLCKYESAPDRQAWQDYNCAAAAYNQFVRGAKPDNHSILQISDIPAFPDPDDYPDLDKERDCSRYITSVGIATGEDLLTLNSMTADQLAALEDVDLFLLEP